MPNQYSNVAQETTLSASVSNSGTTLTVGATTGFPASTPFTLAIDADQGNEELVSVTNVAGTTLTVTRGYDSTAAVGHDTGARVRHVHTAIDFRTSRQHEAASTGVHGTTGAVVGTSDTQTLTNKNLSSGSNTFPSTLVTKTGAETLTNKTVALGSNTVSGTKAQFDAAVTDGDFAYQTDVTTVGTNLTNHSNASTGVHGVTGSVVGTTDTQTLTNKTLASPTITGVGAKQYVYKTGDTSRTSTTTLVDDAHLTGLTLTAGAVYHLTLSLRIDSAVAADFKGQLVVPGDCVINGTGLALATGTSTATYDWAFVETPANTNFTVGGVTGGPASTVFQVNAVVVVTTGGTLKLQWAQNTSSANPATLKAGSLLRLERIS